MFGGAKKNPAPVQQKRTEDLPPKPNAPKGAYIFGGCGCGKTVLLDLFFRTLPEDLPARRLHYHEFIRDAFRAMQGHPAGANVFEAMAKDMSKQFRVLLLDELVITHISEAILIKNLFRHMWARGMTVLVTSNYRQHELYSAGFNRDQFVDFIPELSNQCPLVDLSGDVDYRQVDTDGGEIFFHPLGPDTKQRFDQVFSNMVGDQVKHDAPLPIPLEKRSIVVPSSGVDARGAAVARFSFEDLFVKSCGRADYSAIATKYHAVFIHDVPKFAPDLGAEFNRFVSFTDIVYSKKGALYLQSAVPTSSLFEDSQGSAELNVDEMWAFRRCSSMLAEMQSPKYHHMVWLMRNHMLQDAALYL